MGFFSEFKKAASGETAGETVEVAGKQLVCSHCQGTTFLEGKGQLNTRFLTFVDLEWVNRQATVYECGSCGHLEWFL